MYSKSVGFFSPTKEKYKKRRELLFGFGLWTYSTQKNFFFFESFCVWFYQNKVKLWAFFFLGGETRDFFFFFGGGLFESKYHPSVCNNKQTNKRRESSFCTTRFLLEPMIFWEFSTNRPSVGRLFFNYISKRERKGIQPHKKNAAWVV